MLTVTEKRDFAFSTIRPMATYTMPYLTQVIGVLDDHTGEYRGTGIYLMMGGRQAVVTAAHVLREAATTGRYSSLTFSRGWGEPPAIVAGTIRYFDEIDIAVYLPSRDFPIGRDKEFWREERIERGMVRPRTDYLFVQGFPVRFARFSTLLGGLVSETVSSGAMMRLGDRDFVSEIPEVSIHSDLLPDGLLKDHQFAFDFSPDAEKLEGPDGSTSRSVVEDWRELFLTGEGQSLPGQRLKGAYGLSGSPVWRIGASDGPTRDWTPLASRLVGIVTDWNPDHKILIATSTAKLLDILPEL
jgi:hypothetical protein